MVCWKHLRKVHVGNEFDTFKVKVNVSTYLLFIKVSKFIRARFNKNVLYSSNFALKIKFTNEVLLFKTK